MPRILSGLAFALLCVFTALSAQAAGLEGVRLGLQEKGTRIVLDIGAPLDYAVKSEKDPYLITIDLPPLASKLEEGKKNGGKGLVASYEGMTGKNFYRVTFSLKYAANIADIKMLPPASDGKPYRLMLDLTPVAAAAFKEQSFGVLKTAGAEKKDTKGQVAAKIEPPRKKIVVIDAGHGGADPGAIGRRGTYEKNVTLLAAKELKRQLEKNGQYEAVLTRDKDFFIPLRDRVRIAREAKADLFISLHADSHTSRDVKGASVYMLSEKASDEETAKLAERENKADLIGGVDLQDAPQQVSNILLDLVQQETRGRSNYYGTLLANELEDMGHALESPLRAAGFAVLKAPDVPSVLVEMGFLSNAQDESLLLKPEYRQKLAESIAQSITNYFDKIENSPHI